MTTPRPEHPRPQFYRKDWLSLNGTWKFAFDRGNSGEERGFFEGKEPFEHAILVPFAPEAELSGIGYTDFMSSVWYRRSVILSADQLSQRVFLHFGAVDYRCTVAVNGIPCGTHTGGYSSFCFDISEQLREGENWIVVHAEDDVRSGKQARGKQSKSFFSAVCDYTRTTGIWQSVWLEFVPQTRIEKAFVTADAATGNASFRIDIKNAGDNCTLQTELFYEGTKKAERTICVHEGSNQFEIQIDSPELWSAGDGRLYDIRYMLLLDGKSVDQVESYFGFRTVSIEKSALCINGEIVFQRLVLDQGFYPQGIYTAKDEEELKRDIELSMSLGFNGARLHEKVFEERYLYWADKLGYLVWGEYANWGLDISQFDILADVIPEWIEVVERDFNHPSIIGWCPFNETWDYEHKRQDNRILSMIYNVTKVLDSSRPVIDTSGNYHVKTDVYDIHDYEQDVGVFAENYGRFDEGAVYERYTDRQKYEGQPYFVSEYGGMWWAPGQEGGWGYGKAPESEGEVIERYVGLTAALMDNPSICAFCYTQLYDVEQEQNGLYTYGREKKFSEKSYEKIRTQNQKKAAIER